MTAIAVEQLLYLLDKAFSKEPMALCLGNLGSVKAEHWLWTRRWSPLNSRYRRACRRLQVHV